VTKEDIWAKAERVHGKRYLFVRRARNEQPPREQILLSLLVYP